MFNIMILDVAIGMIFIYLLLSLMCSAANEIIELMLKKRAVDLERGIRELLRPGSDSGDADIVRDLYNHPLINGLFEGTYETSRIAEGQRYVRRTLLPSYIPARNFALAIMDLIKPGGDVPLTSGATNATAGPPLPEGPSPVIVNVAGVTPPAVEAAAAAVPDRAVEELRAALTAPAAAANVAPPGGGPAPVVPQITDQVRRALIPLIDAAGNDMIKVRENIEAWFDASMQRVSGWYKRRAQVTLMILGIILAVIVNADTITVVKRLSTDKALRESLVAAANAYSAENAKTEAPTEDSKNGDSAAKLKAAAEEACKEPNAGSTACQRARELERACKVENSPGCKYVSTQQQLRSIGLPIGWDDPNDQKRTFAGWTEWGSGKGGPWEQFKWHWLGWLLTAIAISLGAPFWFDLLNKFMSVRSTVKPEKKTSGT